MEMGSDSIPPPAKGDWRSPSGVRVTNVDAGDPHPARCASRPPRKGDDL